MIDVDIFSEPEESKNKIQEAHHINESITQLR